jgi:DNA-binding CsgD family transcriptional regulator
MTNDRRKINDRRKVGSDTLPMTLDEPDSASSSHSMKQCAKVVAILDSAADPEAMGEKLLEVTKSLGVEQIILGVLQDPQPNVDERGTPFQRHWRLCLLSSNCPADDDNAKLSPTCINAGGSIHANYHFIRKASATAGPAQAALNCNVYSLLPGIAFPLISIDKQRYGIVFFGKELPVGNDDIEMLAFIGNFAFAKILKIDNNINENMLTVRQTEVLRLASEGKTDEEISKILSISRYTVDKYIRQAKVALNATNRTAAIVLALRYGLIG